jgi:hypothetical protein
VIVEIFVTQCNCGDALGKQSSLVMDDEDRVSRVRDRGVESLEEPRLFGNLAE